MCESARASDCDVWKFQYRSSDGRTSVRRSAEYNKEGGNVGRSWWWERPKTTEHVGGDERTWAGEGKAPNSARVAMLYFDPRPVTLVAMAASRSGAVQQRQINWYTISGRFV
nr:hypothetical protein CFP56_50348 [Quercus suber]